MFWQSFLLSAIVLMIDLLNFIMALIHKEGRLTDLKDSILFQTYEEPGTPTPLNTASEADSLVCFMYIFY